MEEVAKMEEVGNNRMEAEGLAVVEGGVAASADRRQREAEQAEEWEMEMRMCEAAYEEERLRREEVSRKQMRL